MKKQLILLLLVVPFTAYSQEIKEYSGSYDNGEATYQYYDNDDSERVFNGHFSFTNKKNNVPNSTESARAVGEFKNNLKEGPWQFTYKVLSNAYLNTGYCTDVIVINYKGGKANGLATYTRTLDLSKKIIIRSIAHFKENIQVGDYVYNEDTSNKSITAHLSESGFFDGDCIIKFKYGTKLYQDEIKYNQGILVSRLYKDITEGNVVVNIKANSFIEDFFANYNSTQGTSTIPLIELDNRYPTYNFQGSCAYISNMFQYGYGTKKGPSSDNKGEIYQYKNLTLRLADSEVCLPTRPGFPETLIKELNFWQFNCVRDIQPSGPNSPKYCQGAEAIIFKPVKNIVVYHPGID